MALFLSKNQRKGAKMKIEKININFIKEYENNAKQHDIEHIEKIKNSIKNFDFMLPLLIDEDNMLLAGHGRLCALKELGYSEVEVIRHSHLSEEQKRAYIIADNQLTLATDFDRDKIQKELMELKNLDFDISILGFEEKELEDLVKEIDFQPVSEEEQPRLDKLDPKYITCPHCGEVFDAREQE